MKKKFVLLILFILGLPLTVEAAGSYKLNVASSVEVGGRVTATLTLSNTAAWNIKIVSSGSTSGCSQNFADATSDAKNTTKQLSVTCKATGVGSIVFTVTGDITSADGTKTNVSTSKGVKVTEPRPKATDSSLSSLSVEGYDLSPEFSKDVLDYSISLPPTADKIKIEAKTNESHATLEGTGEFEVVEGANIFKVTVTAENGSTQTYTLTVNVEDENPIKVKIADKSYTLIKNAKKLEKPELYEETVVKINNFDIPAFYSDVTKFTLVGIKDDLGNINLAIYDTKEESYTLYKEYTANSVTLYIVDFPEELSGYIKDTIKINEVAVPVYRLQEDSQFVVVYAMDLVNGKYNYYSYDTINNTFQIYNDTEINVLKEDLKTYTYVCLAFGIGLICAVISIISLLRSSKKIKKQAKAIMQDKENRVAKVEKTNAKKTKDNKKDKTKPEPKEEENQVNKEFEDEETEMYDILETLNKKKKNKNK